MKKNLRLCSILIIAMFTLSACGEAKIEKVETTSAKAANTTVQEEKTPEKKTEEPKKEEAPVSPEIFKVGDSVTFNNLVITLNSVKNHSGGDFQKPAKGKTFKVVDVTVENKGDKEETVSSVMHTSLADSDGYTYNMTIATFIDNQLDGQVPAGRKLRGKVVYEVPKDAPGLEFIFKDPFSKGQAIWSLK